MITITIKRNQEKQVKTFTVSGHALYADPGEDIICSAVSAISIGTINAAEKLLSVQLDAHTEIREGFLHCVLPTVEDKDTHEKLQLLLEGMIVSFESITMNVEYESYIKLIDRGGERHA